MAIPRTSGIYEIFNTVNSKRYIGSSVDIASRWLSHKAKLRNGNHHCQPLQRAWVKYGEDSFEFRVICICPKEFLIDAEQGYLDTILPEYNVAVAAGYRTFLGLKHTPETLAKMSAAHMGNTRTKGMKRNPEAVAATASAHRGMRRSDETRRKISEAKAGKSRAPYSDETRAKLSAAHKGKKKSAEHMAALQAGRTNRVYTEEQRAAIGDKSRAAWARRKAERAA